MRKIELDGNVSTIQGFTGIVGGLAFDPSGNIYISSHSHHQIFKVNLNDEVELFAGNGDADFANANNRLSVSFNQPSGMCIDSDGNLYLADSNNHAIRKISSDGRVSTLAGSGSPGYVDGSLGKAKFNRPRDVTIDDMGSLYIADSGNSVIRKISSENKVSSLVDETLQVQFPTAISIYENTLYVFDSLGNGMYKFELRINR